MNYIHTVLMTITTICFRTLSPSLTEAVCPQRPLDMDSAYLPFCAWPLLLSVMFSWFIHTVALFLSLLRLNCMYITSFVYPFLRWRMVRFPCFGYCNAAVNMGVRISVQVPAFSSFGCTPRSGIGGSYGDSMFNFLRNCRSVFHSSYTSNTFFLKEHSFLTFCYKVQKRGQNGKMNILCIRFNS